MRSDSLEQTREIGLSGRNWRFKVDGSAPPFVGSKTKLLQIYLLILKQIDSNILSQNVIYVLYLINVKSMHELSMFNTALSLKHACAKITQDCASSNVWNLSTRLRLTSSKFDHHVAPFELPLKVENFATIWCLIHCLQILVTTRIGFHFDHQEPKKMATRWCSLH